MEVITGLRNIISSDYITNNGDGDRESPSVVSVINQFELTSHNLN